MRLFDRYVMSVFVALACILAWAPMVSADEPVCGDEACHPRERNGLNPNFCSEDCPETCGNNYCSFSELLNETCYGTPQSDCPAPSCGDNLCTVSENSTNCATDCPVGGVCGNSQCESEEEMYACPEDCPADCGDLFCSFNEAYNEECSVDCGPVVCGDSFCSGSEPGVCLADCPE